MIDTGRHTAACLDAWMKCEELLAMTSRTCPIEIRRILDECALICMSAFHAFKTRSINCDRFALLCIGICEECADLCAGRDGTDFKDCALSCRRCSNILSRLLILSPPTES